MEIVAAFGGRAGVVVFLYTAPIFAAPGLRWRRPVERLGWVAQQLRRIWRKKAPA
jgi:hypothetical protein